jgi:hypothetical protein
MADIKETSSHTEPDGTEVTEHHEEHSSETSTSTTTSTDSSKK